jgi:MauM/NapG family ferredoxin protein
VITGRLRRVRPWVQLAAFLLFIGLLIAAGRSGFIPADLFYRLDPLAGIAGAMAARRVVPALLIGAAIALLAALFLGRAWCGWLCPLGTLLDSIPARQTKHFKADPTPRLRAVKYFLLAVIGIAALLGNLTFLVLDPITLTYRTTVAAAWPALNALISAAEQVLYRVPLLQSPIDAFETALRGAILPVQQPLYAGNILIALLFAGILALNAVRRRFWCRYLCPLGALLGLVSKIAWLRRGVGSACIDCQRCARACPVGTIDPARDFRSDPSECIMCLDCVPVCPGAGQQFAGHWHFKRGNTRAESGVDPNVTSSRSQEVSDPRCSGGDPAIVAKTPVADRLRANGTSEKASAPLAGTKESMPSGLDPAPWQPYDLSRRQFLAATGTALVAAGLFRSEPAVAHDAPHLILPPGAVKPEFLSRCIRCGICLKVCPTSGLQPSMGSEGWAGTWTPALVPRLGQCDYGCNACGQQCPTGAIPPLDLDAKRETVIGHATIDQNRCLPWADNRTCLVCEEMCPLSEKAILLEEVTVQTVEGSTITLKRPRVLRDRCIGCGICENRCPLNGEAAIRVYAPTDLTAIT